MTIAFLVDGPLLNKTPSQFALRVCSFDHCPLPARNFKTGKSPLRDLISPTLDFRFICPLPPMKYVQGVSIYVHIHIHIYIYINDIYASPQQSSITSSLPISRKVATKLPPAARAAVGQQPRGEALQRLRHVHLLTRKARAERISASPRARCWAGKSPKKKTVTGDSRPKTSV